VLALERCAPARVARIGLLGYGRIGQAVASLAWADGDRLAALGLDLRLAGALVKDGQKPRSGPSVPLFVDAAALLRQPLDLVIDVMGGVDPAFDYVRRALEAGIPVVSANKTLVANRGNELRAIARRHGTTLACDAAVLAGVPFLGALSRRPFISGARRISGIINGTSHYLATALANGAPFAAALDEAIARGYAEPDSEADVSGRDAAEKLTILLHLAGCRDVRVADLTRLGLDALTPDDFAGARDLGGAIKPVAVASLEADASGAWVGPAFVDRAHPFAAIHGVANIVEFRGAGALPVTFSGPGAGPDVTAATILDDVAESLAARPSQVDVTTAVRHVDGYALRTPPPGEWFLRISHSGLESADLAERLAARRVPALRLSSRGDVICARTAPAPWGVVATAVTAFTTIGARVLALPALDN
jgi:homoserine dehydrogenase